MRMSLVFGTFFCGKYFPTSAFFHEDKVVSYRNDPKFLDRLVWAKGADPDQTAPRGAV